MTPGKAPAAAVPGPGGANRTKEGSATHSSNMSRRDGSRIFFSPPRDTLMMAILVCTLSMVIAAPMIEWLDHAGAPFGAALRRVWYPTLAFAALVVLPGRVRSRINPFPIPVLVVLLWFCATLTWSDSPSTSAVRLAVTSLSAWIVFATVRQLRKSRSITIVRYVLAAALVVNYFAVFAFPETGVLQDEVGNWQGIMTEKNQAGALCGVTCLFWLIHVPPRLRRFGIGIAIASGIFLIFTWSRTAIIMTLISYFTYLALNLAEKKNKLSRLDFPTSWNVLTLTLFGVIFFFIVYFTFISDFLHVAVRDPEFMSKRGMIWRPMIEAYLDRPIGGTGFGAFWSASANDRTDFGGSWLYRISQGHNGFLDLALQTGAVGLILALIATFIWPVNETIRQLSINPEHSAFAFSLVVFCLGSNVSESGLFERDRLWQIFLMFGLALLHVRSRGTSNPKASGYRKPSRRRRSKPAMDYPAASASSVR